MSSERFVLTSTTDSGTSKREIGVTRWKNWRDGIIYDVHRYSDGSRRYEQVGRLPSDLNARSYAEDVRAEETGKPGDYQILTDKGRFREKHYKNEEELERLVVGHASEVFGGSTLYFDLKQRVTSKLGFRVTDGLLLDFRNRTNPSFWVVEYELNSHDLRRVVIPQLRQFVKAFHNEKTIAAVTDSVYNEVKTDARKLEEFKKLVPDGSELYLSIKHAFRVEPSILLVYDKLPENIDMIFEEEDFDYDTLLMEFRTFEKDSQLIHLVNPLFAAETSHEEKVPHFVRSRRPGERLDQVLEVAVLMKAGQSWNKACHAVAAKKGIWHNTVMSATTRGLGLSGKAEFESYLREGKLAGLLVALFPEAKDRIQSRLL